ncbi:GDSL-type esterase/lipase family protein, partial [Frankia sp. EI5c]|uniref:GDSL-type esterase/lipase family protein n=1 Tax=Frankia sp. EI5c TaxID=683316 RepID=UPI001F5BBD19
MRCSTWTIRGFNGPRGRNAPFTWVACITSVALVILLGSPAGAGGARPAGGGALTLAALGDSYSSGEGSPPFELAAGRCRRSAGAWPRLLAGLNPPVTTVLHAACGGATTRDLTRSQGLNRPQLDQLRALPQAPDVVTITIGGNDAGFSR